MGNICWVASYPKSGNTWMRAFLANYLNNSRRPVDINSLFEQSQAESRAKRYEAYVPGGDTMAQSEEELCAIRTMVHAEIARESAGTAFVKTHNFLGEFRGYPLHNMAVTSGGIYIVRNPLDVAVSVARYFDFTLDEAIDSMAEDMTGTPNEPENVPQIITSWSMHVQSWTTGGDGSVLVVRYEDMLANPLKLFRKVTSFLNLGKDSKRLKLAIENSSFRQMKHQESSSGFVERHEDAQNFFRAGKKDQWRDVLTPDQVSRIVDRHGEQMQRFKYLPGEHAGK